MYGKISILKYRKLGKLAFVCFIFIIIFYFIIMKTLPYIYRVGHGELPCFIDSRTRSNLRYMIGTFDRLMTKYNLSTWIDYGTLLGSVRRGDVIDFDHDGDMGYMWQDMDEIGRQVAPELRAIYGIYIKATMPVQMVYNGTKVDLFAYGTYKKLKKDLPSGKHPSTLTRMFYRNSDFEEQTYSDMEYEWIFPLKHCRFGNVSVSCPNNAERVLRQRYPYTITNNLTVPFKFWCYANLFNFLKIVFHY